MKKILFIGMLLFSFSAYSQDGSGLSGTVKVNFDLSGVNKVTDVFYSDSLSGEQSVDPGYSIAIEASNDVTNFMSLGAGVAFQFLKEGDLGFPPVDTTLTPEEIEESKPQGKFAFLPVYALLKITAFKSRLITPHVVGHIGYNLYHGDDIFKGNFLLGGGLYYGVGVALDFFENYQFEAMYKVNKGKASHAEDKFFKAEYSYLSLSLGINLR